MSGMLNIRHFMGLGSFGNRPSPIYIGLVQSDLMVLQKEWNCTRTRNCERSGGQTPFKMRIIRRKHSGGKPLHEWTTAKCLSRVSLAFPVRRYT